MASHQEATAKSFSSAIGWAASCTAKGRPLGSMPVGMDIAGKPEKVHGRLKTLEPVEASPFGAVEKAIGINAASTDARHAAISFWKTIL